MDTIYFYNELHEENFKQMLDKYPLGKQDPEYRVACYIVAHPEIYPKATRKSWDNIFDDWVEEEDFSSGFRQLINLGQHLYSGGSHEFNLFRGMAIWGTENYLVFRQAVEIRKGWA